MAESLGSPHPHCRALYGEDIRSVGTSFCSEVRLDLRTDERDDLVAEKRDGDIDSTLSTSVKPDHERIGHSVTLERPRLIRGVCQGYIARFACKPACVGSLTGRDYQA